jgi:hypothetical protein
MKTDRSISLVRLRSTRLSLSSPRASLSGIAAQPATVREHEDHVDGLIHSPPRPWPKRRSSPPRSWPARRSSPPRPRTACRSSPPPSWLARWSSPRGRGPCAGARPHCRRTSLRELTTTSLRGGRPCGPRRSARAWAAGHGRLAAAVARPRASAGRATSGGRRGPRATASGAPTAAGGARTASPGARGDCFFYFLRKFFAEC